MVDAPLATPDLVLANIALWLGLASLCAVALPVSAGAALGVGSLPAGGSIGYALFLDPPSDG